MFKAKMHLAWCGYNRGYGPCICDSIKYKEEKKEMADKPMPAEVPKTRIERFRESADQLKDKNKKMQEAIKYLDKHPGLENFLEEFMKAGQNGWA